MEINEFNIKLKTHSRKEWVYLIPLGDLHLGNAGADLKKFKSQIEYIKNKSNCFWVGMGDYLDCINYSDKKRFDPAIIPEPFRSNLDNCVPFQIAEFVKLIAPIINKCIGLHRGNHEEAIRKYYQVDVLKEISRAFNFKVKLLQDAALTRIRLIRPLNPGITTYDIFSTHGNVGGKKGGAKINRLEDMIGYIDADIYLMGHSHIKATSSRSVLFIDHTLNVKHKKRVMAVTGCFLNGYVKGVSSYVEKWGFPPSSTGCVKLMLKSREKDIHISE